MEAIFYQVHNKTYNTYFQKELLQTENNIVRLKAQLAKHKNPHQKFWQFSCSFLAYRNAVALQYKPTTNVVKLFAEWHRGAFCQFPFRWNLYETAIVVNPPERKLEKRTSVQWGEHQWFVNDVTWYTFLIIFYFVTCLKYTIYELRKGNLIKQ